MTRFPFIEHVTVHDYKLYPGRQDVGVLDIQMGGGPWLVLGVNGLGKSTLLLLMRYLMTGPVRIRQAGFAGERDDLQAVNNRFFAVRVPDGAQDAVAKIQIRFGKTKLTIERSLADLALKAFHVEENDSYEIYRSESEYREKLISFMQLTRFEDAVRIFDNVVFYLESRQPLIWDGAAQFELFRALLTPKLSSELRRLEGEIVSADSTARNLSAALYKLTQRRDKESSKKISADDTRARISSAQGELDALSKNELILSDEVEASETQLADYRLQQKRGEQSVDNAAQAYEKIKFEMLRQAFAGVKPTEQYIFLKLLSDRICIACNNHAADAAEELQKRNDTGRCVICGNKRNFQENVESIGDAFRSRSAESFTELERLRSELIDQKEQYAQSEHRTSVLRNQILEVRLSSDRLRNLIRQLRKNLPSEESLALAREEDRIASLRQEVRLFREEREAAEREIGVLLDQLRTATEEIRERLENAFDERAAPFFAEKVRLVYSPRVAKIGQGGRSFEFPAFEVEMTSGATLGQYIRRSPDQVSLSQREYLDLIFRMILIETFGGSSGSLVVDGPEVSLDAVFAGRAGDLFSQFSHRGDANVILACNIVEGGFIPHTLTRYSRDVRFGRVINLLEQATPTQALATLRPLYLAKVAEILDREPEL